MRELLDRIGTTATIEPTYRVLALGSPHGDDRAPWLIADRLLELGASARCVCKVSSPFEVVSHIDSSVDLIVVDVCVSGAPPGTVVRFDESKLKRLVSGVRTSHGGSLVESVELAAALGRRPRSLCVLAVEMAPIDAEPGKTDVSRHCIEPLLAELVVELSRVQSRNKHFRS
jgi:hydrogenase maturation protease